MVRSLYAFARGQNIYLLHAFVKKTEKTPAAAIKTDHTRLKEFK
ncbi:type II toxin-antitoxin system RelE/ParE family toxin [Photorhabdus aegyptia]